MRRETRTSTTHPIEVNWLPVETRIYAGTGPDTVWVRSVRANTTVHGGQGKDSFVVSVHENGTGDLDKIRAPLTFVGGRDSRRGSDSLYVGDCNERANVGYLVTPTSITHQPPADNLGMTRRFAGIYSDGTTKSVSLHAGRQPNVIEVQPSIRTTFHVNGNLPAPGTVLPGPTRWSIRRSRSLLGRRWPGIRPRTP